MKPSRRLGDLPLELVLGIPRASITHRTSARAIAFSTEDSGKVLLIDLLQQVVLVGSAQYVDLGHGDLVQPRLDDAPDRRKRPRSVDDVELAHTFGITILTDRCRLHHEVLDAVEVGNRYVVKIKDRTGRFHGVANGFRASRETFIIELLVFVHQPFELTLLRGDGVEGLDIKETQPLDIYRPTILDIRGYIGSHSQWTRSIPCLSYDRTAGNTYRLQPFP